MATASLEHEIRRKVEEFAADVARIVRLSALHAVNEALGARPAATGPAPAGEGDDDARKGQKRSAEELETLTARLEQQIRSHPWQRMEEIADALGVTTRELTLPARKLLASSRIQTRGERRATRYAIR